MPLRITQRINFSANTIITYFFSLIIIFGSCLNLAANNSYVNDSWTLGEWLINYQGGFVRRGLLGEVIFLISDYFRITPIYIIWIICLSSYLFLIKLSFGMVKNLVSTSFLLSPAIFLSPIIGNFLVRKDILLLLLFVCNLRIIKANKSNIFFINLINIFATLIHEGFFIYALPIQFFLKLNKNTFSSNKNLFKNILFFLPSIIVFLLCFIFKGSDYQASLINNSWIDKSFLFPFDDFINGNPSGAIDAIGWGFNDVVNLLSLSLRDFKGFLWVPIAWGLTILIIGSIFLGDNKSKDAKLKLFILSFQFIPLILLCLLGWDYGRWVFIWITSSIFIYSNFSNEIKNLELYRRFSCKFNFLKNNKFSIELNRKSKILLIFTSYPHCCWSLFYVPTLLVVPLYSFLKSEFLRNK